MKWQEKNGIEYWTVPPEKAEECLDVLRHGFFEDEAFCNNVGIAGDKAGQRDLEELCLETIKDELSIMAVEKETLKIVGVSINKYQVDVPPGQKSFLEQFRDSKFKTKSAVALINEMLWFDGMVNLLEKYNTDCSIEIFFLATHRDYRNRGIAIGCIEATLALAKTLPSATCPKQPAVVTAIFTSPFSIKAGRRLEFDEVIHIPAKDRKYEGKEFSAHPKVGPNHPGFIVMAKCV